MALPSWPSAAYTTFSWQVMKARPAIHTLLNEASKFAPAEVKLYDVPETHLDVDAATVKLIALAGRGIRDDISAVIRHNCAGAVLQIAYSLFENYAKSLVKKPGPSVRCGWEIGGEPYSRMLWASRSAFAHGDEWKRQGPAHSLAKIAYPIIEAMGFLDPASVSAYELYQTLADGSEDVFIERLLAAAKDLADNAPAMTPDEASAKAVLWVLGGTLSLLMPALFRGIMTREDTTKEPKAVIFTFVYRKGENAISIPIAEGEIRNPVTVAKALRDGAIARLSEASSRPFREVGARLEAWFAEVQTLLASSVDDPSFHSELVGLAERAEKLYERFLALPDPFTVLMDERATSFQDGQRIMAELLEPHGFTPLEFREVSVDIKALGSLAEHLPANA